MTFLDYIMRLPLSGGIYEIKNLRGGGRYIGQSQCIRIRAFEHYRKLELKIHLNYLMQKEYRVHGRDAFKVRVIELCATEELTARERFHIDKRKPEYNIEARRCALSGTKLLEEATNRRQANKKGGRLPARVVQRKKFLRGHASRSLKLPPPGSQEAS